MRDGTVDTRRFEERAGGDITRRLRMSDGYLDALDNVPLW